MFLNTTVYIVIFPRKITGVASVYLLAFNAEAYREREFVNLPCISRRSWTGSLKLTDKLILGITSHSNSHSLRRNSSTLTQTQNSLRAQNLELNRAQNLNALRTQNWLGAHSGSELKKDSELRLTKMNSDFIWIHSLENSRGFTKRTGANSCAQILAFGKTGMKGIVIITRTPVRW